MILNHLKLRIMIREKFTFPLILSKNFDRKYKTVMNNSYEETVNCINSLQSNQSYIKNAASQGVLPHSAIFATTIAETKKFLLRTGISLDQLDKLSIIHVAGTKGKGSTCAFSESILREHGYKTGFYSSPHLVAIRERIRLNGKPLSKELFAENAYQVYNKLMDTREHSKDMPQYFRFLTILAFNIFLKEKVDVAVVEVGIGGEYDCTNVVRNTPVVGITSLGIDHTSILGNTIEQIAWQKSGIMKKNSKVFTVPQIDSAMNIIKERSIEKECSLEIVPNFEEYIWNNGPPVLGIHGEIQKINASLAIQLSHTWLKIKEHDVTNTKFENKLIVPENTINGLKNCKWPGRNQILKKSNLIFYLDGAHTTDSLAITADWFNSIVSENSYKVLIFNATGDRNSENLLKQLIKINFNSIMFIPNTASSSKVSADQTNLIVTNDEQIKRCEAHKNIWLKLHNLNQEVAVYSSIEEGLKQLPNNKLVEILITGSLHLIGAALTVLDPDLQTF